MEKFMSPLFLGYQFRNRQQKRLVFGFVLLVTFVVSGCKAKPFAQDSDASEILAKNSAIGQLYDSQLMSLIEKRISLAFLGVVSSKNDPDVFFPGNQFNEFLDELRSAESAAKSESSGSGKYNFAKCEAAMQFPETTSVEECSLFSKGSKDLEFEFSFLPSDGKRICTKLGTNCNIHQVISVRTGNSFQRPALYISKTVLGDLNLVLMRPNKHHREVIIQILPGDRFDRSLGEKLAKLLKDSSKDVQNPIHLSNIWRKKTAEVQLADARNLAFFIASIPLNGGAIIGGVKALANFGKISMLARYLAVVDVASGVVGTFWGGVGILGIKDHINSVPPGPARACLQMAIVLADASPMIGSYAIAHAPLKLGVNVFAKFSLMIEASKRAGLNWKNLSPQTITAINRIVAKYAQEFFNAAKAGGAPELAKVIKRTTSELGK